jgi:predicted nucleotide-binding protein
VRIWPRSGEQQVLGELYAFNVAEDELRPRFIDPYDQGLSITWDGRTIPGGDIATISIFRTEHEVAVPRYKEHETIVELADVTNDFIVGAPGHAATEAPAFDPQDPGPEKDPQRVMVVHGRNIRVRNAMFQFLRSLGLQPIEWVEAVAATGQGAPYNFDAVRAAMDVAQAVVVILTAEDRAGLLPGLAGDDADDDELLRGQPRQNVVIEAGLAMGVDRARTLLVEVGRIRRASDFDGLHAVRIDNGAATRADLRQRLMTAGCAVNQTANDWADPEASGDFEAAVVQWEATEVPGADAERQQQDTPDQAQQRGDPPQLFLTPRAIANAGPGAYDHYVEVTNYGPIQARDLQVKAFLHDQVVAATDPRNVHPLSVSEFVLTIPFAGSADELRRQVTFVATDRLQNEWRWDA